MCFCFGNLELKRLFSFLLINRPKDAREAHVGPGAFYVDNVNGKTEVCIFSLKENYESVRKLKRPETFPEKCGCRKEICCLDPRSCGVHFLRHN